MECHILININFQVYKNVNSVLRSKNNWKNRNKYINTCVLKVPLLEKHYLLLKNMITIDQLIKKRSVK